MLLRFQLLGLGHCVVNWRQRVETARLVEEKAALRQQLHQEHHNTSAREQELKLSEARMQKDMKSTSEEAAVMEQKLKEAELRWEEADAMVRALERKIQRPWDPARVVSAFEKNLLQRALARGCSHGSHEGLTKFLPACTWRTHRSV